MESGATSDPSHPDAVSGPSEAGEVAAESGTSAEAAGDGYTRGRAILVNGLIGLGTLLLVIGVFAVWANRLLFSPENWGNTSTQLLQSPNIRSQVSNYAIDQLYANVNVAGLIKSGLPTQLQPLAAPAAGALRNVAVQGVDAALTRPRVQEGWAAANRAADRVFIEIAGGGNGIVGVKQGVVTLNLSQLLNGIAVRLGLPSSIVAKIPPNIANLTILKSTQLKYVQDGGDAIRSLALWLTILAPLCYALAILLAGPRRRRKLMAVGWAAVLGGALVILGRKILINQIAGSVTSDASLKPAITDTVSIMTQMLHQIAAACIIVGIPLIIAAWFAGPGRWPRLMREAIAPYLRDHPVGTYAITLGVMTLIFIWDPIHATGTPAGIIVFTLLALLGTYVLRRQCAEEFPDARKGAATAKLRAWWASKRGDADRTSAATGNGAGTSVSEQLERLSSLRNQGELSQDEYQAAKAQVLQSV